MTESTQRLLEGKSALVSGGGRGIGRATALAMASEGASVAVADLNGEAAEQTADEIQQAGGTAISITVEIADAAQVESMVRRTIEAFSRLDCAFNNAGIAAAQVDASGAHTADWTEAGFDRMIAVNLKGVWLAMRAQLQVMKPQGSGSIVNTASVAGLTGLTTSSGYSAAKHGVIGLTKTAAAEYATVPVRVNAVCPGFIETDMTRDVMARKGDQVLARTPMNRMGTSDEIAQLVCWLSSDRASYVTGVAYNVDGGYISS